LLEAIADYAHSLNIDQVKELVFPDFSEESDGPGEGGKDVEADADAASNEWMDVGL
jgi:hypothetical protein